MKSREKIVKKKPPEFLKTPSGYDSVEYNNYKGFNNDTQCREAGSLCLSHSIRGSRADRCKSMSNLLQT